jgi:AcrB/AcrD/AcrF family
VIVLFDFIEEMHEKAEPLERALPDAGIERIRPVMITVGATILALFPLALEGGPLWKPLCYAQIGGLAVATFITLLLVPVFYSIFVLDLKWITWEVAAKERYPASAEFQGVEIQQIIASPTIAVSDSLKLPGGHHDQIPSTIIPGTSLHCRYFRASARHQRPQVRIHVVGWHRVRGSRLRGPGLARPFTLLQALRDPRVAPQTINDRKIDVTHG